MNQPSSGLSHHHQASNQSNKMKIMFTTKIGKPTTRIDAKEMDTIMDKMDQVKDLHPPMDKTKTTIKKPTNRRNLEMTIQNLLLKNHWKHQNLPQNQHLN